MESILAIGHQTIAEVTKELSAIPELTKIIPRLDEPDTLGLPENATHYIVRTHLGYVNLIKHFALLDEKSLAIITEAGNRSAQAKLISNSATHYEADDVHRTLGAENREKLVNFALKSTEPTSPIFTAALNDLTTRMLLASTLASTGGKLEDGDPRSDQVIWGHTKNLYPKAITHFASCHLLERTVTQALHHDASPKVEEMISHKDWLLSAMTGTLYLQNAQGWGNKEITQMWMNSRENGGVGWANQARQDIYNQVQQEHSQQ